jgi:hypothetical protein
MVKSQACMLVPGWNFFDMFEPLHQSRLDEIVRIGDIADREMAKALRCGIASSIAWRVGASMAMMGSPLLVQRFKDPQEGIRNGFAHQRGVICSQPLPKAGLNLGRQALLVEGFPCGRLGPLMFVRGLPGDVGQCGQHALLQVHGR